MFGVVFIAGYLFGTLSQTRNAMDNRNALQAFLFVIFGIYFVWFWAKGQTLAMKTWDIRLVDTAGSLVTQKRALLRYGLSWMWFLPPLLLSYMFVLSPVEGVMLTLAWIGVWAILARLHPQKQFWHDAWSGTRLISWVAPEKPRRSTPQNPSRVRQKGTEIKKLNADSRQAIPNHQIARKLITMCVRFASTPNIAKPCSVSSVFLSL